MASRTCYRGGCEANFSRIRMNVNILLNYIFLRKSFFSFELVLQGASV